MSDAEQTLQVSNKELEHRFGFHAAAIEGKEADNQEHGALRFELLEFAIHLNSILPDGHEKTQMLLRLEEASMWAHKAIARRHPLV